MFTTNFFIHIKRFIPRTLQILIRRALVFRNLPACSNIWPIDPQSSKPPEGWKGWPEGKKFAFIITHDVETEKGLKRCRQLMDIEERMGFRSSFNFVGGDYNIPMDLINEIKERGFEVGVHGLYHKTNIHKSKKTFTEHAASINSLFPKWGAVGFRTPSMYHNLDYAHDLNIEYDASTFDTDPFEPQPDGVGTIFPFWVSGNHDQQGYVELPYTLPQDFLLFILMKEQNINIWKRKLDWIALHGGMALNITHPDYMHFDGTKPRYDEYHVSFYEEYLQYIKDNYPGQYWHALPKDIARFWKNLAEGGTKKISASKGKKKTIWIDLDNSPHVPFFKPIIDELNKQGFITVVSARDCFQVCGLADLAKLEYKKIGLHYGKNIIMKVLGLLIRSIQLMPLALKEKPDLALSHGSRSQILTSSILNIPSVVIDDYEHAQLINKPSYIITPELISDNAIKKFKKYIFKYPGIKEDVYVPTFKPNPSIRNELGIREEEVLVTIRPPATEAHYHNPESELLFRAAIDFIGQNDNTRAVVLPRNEIKQKAWVKNNWPEWCNSGKIIIPEHVVDGLNLIWHSDLVISGGGTMNREAAALGVPVYSIFRGKIGAVDRYLSENGRLVLLTSVEDVHTKIHVNKRIRPDTLKHTNRQTLHKIIEHIEKILMEVR